MKTRSQTRVDIDIDFDDASRSWNANKRKMGGGQYQYICGAVLKANKNLYCQRSRKTGQERCFMHMNSQCIPDNPE